MSLQKNFPKNRAYYFWAIFLSYMVSIDERSSEADKKLFGTLAYRMISKAGADVPAEPVSLPLLGSHLSKTDQDLFKFFPGGSP